ncbi:MAG: RnfH family protein [Gammaproteobacteria bacterium]
MNRVRVQVAYARADRQVVIAITVPADATIECVIRDSGILAQFPEIDLMRQAVGVFGMRASLSDVVRDGDRIEIYRPLRADPKETRRRRAARRRDRL